MGPKRASHRGLRLSRSPGSSVLRGGEGRPGKAEEKKASGSAGSPGEGGRVRVLVLWPLREKAKRKIPIFL